MQRLLVKAVSEVWMGKERVYRFIGPLSLQGAFLNGAPDSYFTI